MNPSQLPFLVEAAILLVAMVLGWSLGRRGKPYGKVKLGLHLFFFLWFSMGYYFIAQALFTDQAWSGTEAAVIGMGLALAVQIVSGIVMLVKTNKPAWLPKVHGVAAFLVLVIDVTGWFLTAAKA